MLNFEFHNPIQFVFGEDCLERIPTLCQGHKVMLVYGGGSVKKNGVYDLITSLLQDNNIEYIDYGGHTAALYPSILEGIELVKKEEVTAVIEVGGASAMDTGKAIAFGAVHENLEDYIEGRKESDGKHLLNIIIPTYPSTGSEGNGVCDIMEYKGGGTELFGAWPDYCLMKPSVTLSLDRKSTAYSMWVGFIQTSGWYLGNKGNEIAKGFSGTVLKVLLKSYQAVMEKEEDITARENIMWGSCVNTMGIFRSGIEDFYPWTLFSVGYIPRVAHGVSYREALAVAYPIWLKAISRYHMEDIRTFFIEIFGFDKNLEDDTLIQNGCDRIRDLLIQGDVPISLSSYGTCPSIDDVKNMLDPEDFGEFSLEEMYQMIEACYAK